MGNLQVETEALTKAATVFKRLREFLGLTQAQAASLLCATQSSISKIDNRPNVKLDVIYRLAAAENCKVKLMIVKANGEEIDLLEKL